MDNLHEPHLSPCRPQRPLTKRPLTRVFKRSPVIQQDITVFISTDFFTAAQIQILCWVGVFFCMYSFIVFSPPAQLLRLSFSFSLSLQSHHSYPTLAPAVTLKQLSTVTMVMHTTILDFCSHRPHYHHHHCHHRRCWDCATSPNLLIQAWFAWCEEWRWCWAETSWLGFTLDW